MRNLVDKAKAITAEDLIRRYDLDGIKKYKQSINTLNDGLTKTNANMEQYVDVLTKDIKELQNQVDGNVMSWFFPGVPTLDNAPANEWITDEDKEKHLGDLYYDQETGFVYRWVITNDEYKWLKLVDSGVAEALALANSAKDTADSKRRTFFDEPTTPYDSGDLWIYNGEIYRCIRSRAEGDWNTADWVNDLIYTDDTTANKALTDLNGFKQEVKTEYVTNKVLEETENSLSSTIETVRIQVDKKNTIFKEQPTTPYIVGDAWIQNEKVYVCKTAREEGDFTIDDWELDLDNTQFATRTQLEQTDNSISLISERVGKIEGEDYVTSAELKVATDSIQSNISATYITKTETTTAITQAKEEAVTEATEKATSVVDDKIQDLPTKEEVEIAKQEAISSAETSMDTKLEDYSTTDETTIIIDNAKQDAIDTATENANTSMDSKLENYSTTTETNDAIDQAKDEAISSANGTTDEKLKKYSTTIEMNNAITQTVNASENSIMLEVNKKVDDEELTSAKIIARINDDTSEAVINADKISLEGKVIDLTAEDVTINSDNLNILEDGKIELINDDFLSNSTFVVRNTDDTIRANVGAGTLNIGTTDQYYHKTMLVLENGRSSDVMVTSNHQETVMYDNYDSGVFYKMDTSYNDDGCHINTGGMPIFLNSKDILEKNYLQIRPTSDYTIQVNNTTEIVPLTHQLVKGGSKLTLNSDGTVTIGAGVSRIKVSSSITWANVSAGTKNLYYYLNESNVRFIQSYGNGTTIVTIADYYIDVNEGDIFSLRTYGTAGEVIRSTRSHLSIEVVE